MFDVVAIGSATRDHFLLREYELTEWKNSPSGKVVVLHWGEKYEVAGVHATNGGNAANAAVTFARQGFQVACAAKVGSDVEGEHLARQLQKEGVRTKLLAHDPKLPTAYSVLLTDTRNGERTILNYHGASDTLSPGNMDFRKMGRAAWWYLSLAGESDAMLPELVSFAREHGIRIAFNPSGHHIAHRRDEILSVLDTVSFLVLNASEAASLTELPVHDGAGVCKKLSGLCGGIVAITDGPSGAVVLDGARVYRAGIFREEQVRDRTGAGDAFGSGFVAGLIRRGEACKKGSCDSQAVQYALRLASANATAVVEAIGATENVLARASGNGCGCLEPFWPVVCRSVFEVPFEHVAGEEPRLRADVLHNGH
jgi:sugar/nucleoside kinase (ribokinase family)